jgi:hypothetical protein
MDKFRMIFQIILPESVWVFMWSKIESADVLNLESGRYISDLYEQYSHATSAAARENCI